jgi:pseudaminic acid synthase
MLKEKYGVEVGFSDHTLGSTAPIVAVTLGAKVIEKHFILDKSIGGADKDFSMEAKDFKVMVEAIRDTQKMLDGIDKFTKEKSGRRFSRSLYINKDIKKGETYTKEHIRSIRPGYGLHPKYLSDILGTVAKKDYDFGDRVER